MLIPNTPTNSNSMLRGGRRGAFVVLEGIDRSGKTSQCKLLLQRLVQAGIAASSMRFPNRTTSTGRIINDYLQSSQNLDDRAIHLLFSANRWEASNELAETLIMKGSTVICDRYAYSGVAFSSAKVFHSDKENNGDPSPLLSLEWCQAPDRGLPAPDCVIFLQLSPEQAEARGGYGEERYEKRDMQLRVRERFAELQRLDEKAAGAGTTVPAWHVIDAAQSMEQVEQEIWDIVQATIAKAQDQPLPKLWQSGDFQLHQEDNSLL